MGVSNHSHFTKVFNSFRRPN